jgi:hypothetical protein
VEHLIRPVLVSGNGSAAARCPRSNCLLDRRREQQDLGYSGNMARLFGLPRVADVVAVNRSLLSKAGPVLAGQLEPVEPLAVFILEAEDHLDRHALGIEGEAALVRAVVEHLHPLIDRGALTENESAQREVWAGWWSGDRSCTAP